jgi:hypothetical protein
VRPEFHYMTVEELLYDMQSTKSLSRTEWSLNGDGGDCFTTLKCLLPMFSVEGPEHHLDLASQQNVIDLVAYGTYGAFGIIAVMSKGGELEIVPILYQLCGNQVTALSWSLDSQFDLDSRGKIHVKSL